MRRIDVIFRILLVAALLAYGAWLGSMAWLRNGDAALPAPIVSASSGMSRGAYIAKMGDCISCHTNPGNAPYAGGLAINAPFGTIYSTNITPDKTYGIGTYSLQDFTRALREGVAQDGHRLYPAMPYSSFAAMSQEDMHALYDYFMQEVKPVHIEPQQTHLIFPFNQRWGIYFWDLAFANHTPFAPREDKDTAWNRGAYLMQSMGHCAQCHSPRGLAYEVKGSPESSHYLTGEILDNWYAPNLRGDKATGLGRWTEEDIAAFLKTGHGAGTVAFGSMAQVVENSTQYLSDEDALAIAHYLKSLPPVFMQSTFPPAAPENGLNERPGAGFYAVSCAKCHQPDGKGSLPGVPKLAGNAAVLSQNPASLIRIILEGGAAPHMHASKPDSMPAFKDKYTDAEIAEIVTFIRRSWGNDAASVSTRDVANMRRALKK